jgi:hypothetical protein
MRVPTSLSVADTPRGNPAWAIVTSVPPCRRAAFASVELVDVARHAVGHSPLADRVRIEQRPIDRRPRRVDVPGHDHRPLGFGMARSSPR